MRFYLLLSIIFISHMVQMKGVIPVPDILANFQLYIPHGSDERVLGLNYD